MWLGVLALARISSLAGMSAVVAAAIAAALFGYPQFVPVLLVIAALVAEHWCALPPDEPTEEADA